MDNPKIGEKWEHFKGTIYEIRGLAVCSETNSNLVLYQEVGQPGILPWSRKLSEWHDHIERDDYEGPRFVLVNYVFSDHALSQQEARVIHESLDSIRENLFDTLKGLASDSEEFKEYTRQVHAIDKVLDV